MRPIVLDSDGVSHIVANQDWGGIADDAGKLDISFADESGRDRGRRSVIGRNIING